MRLSQSLKVTGLSLAIMGMTMFTAQVIAQEHTGHQHEEKAGKSEGKAITVTGEVVDVACYVGHDAKGEKHATCAKQCINGGQPAGVVTSDGKMYIVLGENHKAPSAVVDGVIAKQVKATGKLIEKDGNSFLVVSKIEESKETQVSAKKVYTCSMHPEVISDKPGKCPKCGMTLVLKKNK